MTGFTLTNVRIGGNPPRRCSVRDGRLHLRTEAEAGLPGIDCNGAELRPGLVDNHLHLFAEAARRQSIDLSDLQSRDLETLAERLRLAGTEDAIRATGLDDGDGSLLDAATLDLISPDKPLRVQYRTGGLWVLNSADLDLILEGHSDIPQAFERGADGRPNGRVWRGDTWLRRSPGVPPSLRTIGADLSRWGITAVTDASETTDPAQAAVIARAAAALPQHLTLMSGGHLDPGDGWSVGPVKILLDESDLPPIEDIIGRIELARRAGRAVAAHVVTVAELAFMLAAWSEAGAAPGDRIEHGSVIPEDLIDTVAGFGLTVVTNPGFIFARGDRYLDRVPADDQSSLYRIATLGKAGVNVIAGSDAPYGPLDPWCGIDSAVQRRTRRGRSLGENEGVDRDEALRLYRPLVDAGALADGDCADLIVLDGAPGSPVRMTIIEGEIIYSRETTAE